MKLNFSIPLLLLLLTTFIFSSCNKTEVSEELANDFVALNDLQKEALLFMGINAYNKDIKRINSSEFVPSGGLSINDQVVTNDQLHQYVANFKNVKNGNVDAKHYASTSRVATPGGFRTVRVAIVNFGNISLNQTVINGTFDAVQRYNDLNMNRLNMKFLSLSESDARARFSNGTIDVLIFNDRPNYTGVSGTTFDAFSLYPSNGNPGRLIGFNPTGRALNRTQAATLIMHELGHTLGMVHSDFFTRVSCNGNGNPVGGPLGDVGPAIPEVTGVFHIGGTDTTGGFTDSIMRACGFFGFNSSTFRSQDVTAFRQLYR